MKMAKKKKVKIIVKKTETLEEFQARGGQTTIVPYEEPEEKKHAVRGVSGGLPAIMSLSDGAHFFGETRKKKKKIVTKEESIDKISNSSLPADVMASLKQSIGGSSE